MAFDKSYVCFYATGEGVVTQTISNSGLPSGLPYLCDMASIQRILISSWEGLWYYPAVHLSLSNDGAAVAVYPGLKCLDSEHLPLV
jgi:hypothetical protein